MHFCLCGCSVGVLRRGISGVAMIDKGVFWGARTVVVGLSGDMDVLWRKGLAQLVRCRRLEAFGLLRASGDGNYGCSYSSCRRLLLGGLWSAPKWRPRHIVARTVAPQCVICGITIEPESPHGASQSQPAMVNIPNARGVHCHGARRRLPSPEGYAAVAPTSASAKEETVHFLPGYQQDMVNPPASVRRSCSYICKITARVWQGWSSGCGGRLHLHIARPQREGACQCLTCTAARNLAERILGVWMVEILGLGRGPAIDGCRCISWLEISRSNSSLRMLLSSGSAGNLWTGRWKKGIV